MATAGRILIIPKGEYDANATYEMLDLVRHNGTSWLAKKMVIGIEPSYANSEYWHCMVDVDDSVNIIDNLETTETGSALDATQGKVLNDKIAEQAELVAGNATAISALAKEVENKFNSLTIEEDIADLVAKMQRYNKKLTLLYDAQRTLREIAYHCFIACKEDAEGATYQGLMNCGSMYKFEVYSFANGDKWSGAVTLLCYSTEGAPHSVSFSVINDEMLPRT